MVVTAMLAGLLVAAGPPTVARAAESTEAAPARHLELALVPSSADPEQVFADDATPTVRVLDADDQPVEDVTVTLTLRAVTPDLAGTLSCTATTTGGDTTGVSDEAGTVEFPGCSISHGGRYVLDVTSPEIETVSSGEVFVSGAASVSFTVQPGGGVVGSAWDGQPQLTVVDGNGEPMTGVSTTLGVALKPGTGIAGAILTCAGDDEAVGEGAEIDEAANRKRTTTDGTATFAGCELDASGAGYQLLGVDLDNGVFGTSNPFSIATGSPTRLAFTTQPSGAAGGVVLPRQPVVSVLDAWGNPVTGNADDITLTLTSGAGATLTCIAPVTGVNGVATFDGCAVDRSGTWTLTADASPSGLSIVSLSFTIGAGGATGLVFEAQPSGGAAGTPFPTQPQVLIADAGGNARPGPVTLSLTGGDPVAELICTRNPVEAVSGPASFSGCSVSLPGTGYRLLATDGTFEAESSPFDVAEGEVDAVAFQVQPGNGLGGAALAAQPVVTLTDAAGKPAAGDVTLTLTEGTGAPGAALGCASLTVTALDGRAEFEGCRVDLGAPGYSLTATSAGARVTSERFGVTTGPPAKLAFIQQPGAGTGGSALERQPTVQVQDAGGNPATGTESVIELALAGTGSGSLTCTSDRTPVTRGTAVFAGCSVDRAAPAHRLLATDEDTGFAATSEPFAVTAGPAAAVRFDVQPAAAIAGSTFPTAPVVQLVDAGGNGVQGSVSVELTPGTGASGATLTCAGNHPVGAEGRAVLQGCEVDLAAGGYTLRAVSDPGSTESDGFDVTTPPTPLGAVGFAVPLGQTLGGRDYATNPTDTTDHVNTATGSLVWASDDLTVAGLGVPFQLRRTYQSADTSTGAFGTGWSSVLDLAVTFEGKTKAIVRGEDGQRASFTWSAASGRWVGAPGTRSTLTCAKGGTSDCTVTRFDGVSWRAVNGRVQSYVAASGRGLTFRYAAGKLAAVRVATTGKTVLEVAVSTNAAGRVTALRTPTRTVSYTYAGGRLASFTDAMDDKWTYAWTDGLLSGVDDPLGKTRLDVEYAGGRVASVDVLGGVRRSSSSFDYADGRTTRSSAATVDGAPDTVQYVDTYENNVLVRQDLPRGAILRYSYDAQNNLVAIQDPAGWVQRMVWSPAGDLVEQTTPISSTSSSVVSLTYDSAHRVVEKVDANGNRTAFTYRGADLASIRPAGEPETGYYYDYDKDGLLVASRTFLGRTVFTHDAAGNQATAVPQTLGGDLAQRTGSFASYDEQGNLVSSTDARGTGGSSPDPAYTSTWTYDRVGRLIGTRTPSGATTSSSYDAAGDVVSSADALGRETTFSWDESALEQTTDGPSGETVRTFDRSGLLLTEAGGTGGGETRHVYDALGRETATVAPSGVVTRFRYDAMGRVSDASMPGTTLQRQYDSRGLVVREVVDGAAETMTYDAIGNVVAIRDAGGAETLWSYDARGNLASVSDASGTTRYGYDGADNINSRVDGRGQQTTWTYDPASRPVTMTTAAGVTRYSYDAAGNLVSTADPDGRVVAVTLDGEGRAVRTTHTWAGHDTVDIEEGYDELGRRTSMTDSTGTHTYDYDADGHLTEADGFEYSYSTPGTVLETYPDGTEVSYRLDDTGALLGVTSGAPGEDGYVEVSYVRDAAHRVTAQASSNGVLDVTRLDPAGRVVGDLLDRGGVTLASTNYTYDAAGNRLSQVRTALGETTTQTYAYDGAHQLTGFSSEATELPMPETPDLPTPTESPELPQAGDALPGAYLAPASAPIVPVASGPLPEPSPTYAYDANGNRTSLQTAAGTRSYSYDSADRLVAESGAGGPVTRQYDAGGNETSRTGPAGTRTLTYDAARRLVAVTVSAAGAPTTVRYTYDGDGNRISRVEGGETTEYTWDPAGEVPRLVDESVDGKSVRQYVYGDGPVAMRRPEGTYFFHLDPLGSVDALTDDQGAVVAAYTYDPFGQVTASGEDRPTNPLLFQGQLLDPVTGLYNMRARSYDPTTGRFTQTDPEPAPVGQAYDSAYVFVGNRPTALTDPTGRTPTVGETATTVFWGQPTYNANTANASKLGTTAANLVAKTVSKLGGYGAALAKVETGASQGGKAANIGKGLKFLGAGLAVAGIGLQAYVTVEICMSSSVQACVGASVGLAVSVVFLGLCTGATGGIGAFGCAMAGMTLSLGLQFVITQYGPDIVAGLTTGWEATSAAFTTFGSDTDVAFTAFGVSISDAAVVSYQATVTGIGEAITVVATGFEDAIDTLVAAGLDASELATVLADTFVQAADEVVAGLISVGYELEAIGAAMVDALEQSALDTALLLKDSFDYSAQQVAGVLDSAFDLSAQEAAKVLAGADFAVAEVADALESVYQETERGVAEALRFAEYGALQIGAALVDVFEMAEIELVELLKALEYSVEEVGAVVMDVLNELEVGATALLKSAGYAATQVAEALEHAYGTLALQATELLKDAGYLVSDVAAALEGAYLSGVAEVAALLRDAEYLAADVALALEDVFEQAAVGAAQLLRSVGFAADEVAGALTDVYEIVIVAEVTKLLADVGYLADQVASALESEFGVLATEAVRLLEGAGFAAAQVAGALVGVYDQSATEVAALLNSVGYSLDEVAGVLQNVFGLLAHEGAAVLNSIGVAVADIADVLGTVFGVVGDYAIAGVLQAAGFATDVINTIGGAFEDFGTAVEDLFDDFLSLF